MSERSDDFADIEQLSILSQVDDICTAFEQDYHAGRAPKIEDILARHPLELRRHLLPELIRAELAVRCANGADVPRDEYAARFPDNRSLVDRLFDEHYRAETVPRQAVQPASRDTAQAETDADLTQTFGQNYTILERLGRGGMGVVYKARQRHPDRIVALKLIRSGQLASTEEVRRFRNEASFSGSLQHPNIVPVYEAGEQDGYCYFSMGYIDGESLEDQLRSFRDGEGLSTRQAAEVMAVVADTVHHAHSLGVIHRDLKPGNVLIDRKGIPHVADFGLAKRMDADSSLSVDGQVIGTPGYMPPEQAKGAQVTPQSDVYSIGATLYSLLTGRPPFNAETIPAVLAQVIEREPVSPRMINPSVDRDLETLCLKCLEKEPDHRPESAGELAIELRRYLNGEPIHSRPVSRTERAWRWCRRKPAIAVAVAASTILVLLLSIVGPLVAFEQAELRIEADKALALADSERLKAEEARNDAEEQRDIATRQRDIAEWRLYSHLMAEAQAYLEQEKFSPAFDTLNECRPDFRGWEYDYLYTLYKQRQNPTETLTHNEDLVRGVAVSSDGIWIVSGGNDDQVRVWDTEQREQIHAFKGHHDNVRCVDISPDQQWIASGANDSRICIWKPLTQGPVHELSIGSPVSCLSFSSDSQRIAGGSNDHLARIWDVSTGDLLQTLTGHSAIVRSVDFSPDGTRVVTASEDKTVRIWDADTGRLLKTLNAHSGFVATAIFSPDGRFIVSGSNDKTIRVWDARQGTVLPGVGEHSGSVRSLAFSPDGRQLVSGSEDNTIKVWAWRESAIQLQEPIIQLVITLKGHDHWVSEVTFSPDGRQVISGSFDHTLKIWDASLSQDPIVINAHDHEVRSAKISPDGRQIVSGSGDYSVKIRDMQTGHDTVLGHHDRTVLDVCFNCDGTLVASVGEDDMIHVWNVADHTKVQSLSGFPAKAVAFHPTRTAHLIIGGSGGEVRLWDVESNQTICSLVGHTQTVNDVCFSTDGSLIATAGSEGIFRVWETATGEMVCESRKAAYEFTSVAFSPDDEQLALGTSTNRVEMRSVSDGHVIDVFRGHQRPVNAVAFHPDPSQHRLVSSSDDNTLRIWNTHNGEELLKLTGHTEKIRSVIYDREGSRVISGSDDNTIRIWSSTQQSIMPQDTPVESPPRSAISSNDNPAATPELPDDHGPQSEQDILISESPQARIDGAAYCLAFAPESERLVIGQFKAPGFFLACEVRQIDAGTGEVQTRWQLTPDLISSAAAAGQDGVRSLAFGPEGRWLFVGMRYGRVYCIDTTMPESSPPSWKAHAAEVQQLVVDPGGTSLFSQSQDRTIRRWDISDIASQIPGRHAAEFQRGTASGSRMAVTPDGTALVTRSASTTVKLSADTLERMPDFEPTVPFRDPAFSRSGAAIVAACTDGIGFFDPQTGDRRSILIPTDRFEGKYAAHILLSSNDSIIAAASHDEVLHIWNAHTGRLLKSISVSGSHLYPQFSPDGRLLAIATEEGTQIHSVIQTQ